MLNLVTGGAGFIGSRLVNALVDRGELVVIIDDMSSGKIRNLEHAVQTGRAILIYADAALPFVQLRDLVARATKDPIDRIYHFASTASSEPQDGNSVDTLGTLSLIELALAHSARFLLASTAGGGKRFAEAAVAAAVREHGLEGRIVRPHDCYGPAMHEGDDHLIPSLLRAALDGEPLRVPGSGEELRSPLFVEDAIALVRLVMERRQPKLAPVDIRDRRRHSVEEIARTVARVAGVDCRRVYVPAEGQPGAIDAPVPEEPAGDYGWAPKTSLEAGLRATYTWIREGRLAFA